MKQSLWLAAAAIAVGLVTGSAASAQSPGQYGDRAGGGWDNRAYAADWHPSNWRDGDGDSDDHGYRGNWRDFAFRNGHEDGVEAAAEDIQHRKHFNWNPRGRFEDCDRGYEGRFGSRNYYKQAYKDGYRRGYDEEYRRLTQGYGYPR